VTSSCRIVVRVTTRAAAEEIVARGDGAVLVRVTAPPADGRANAAVCRLLAKRLGVGVSRVSIVRGAKSREKTIGSRGSPRQTRRGR
jgi:uncharacterized protein